MHVRAHVHACLRACVCVCVCVCVSFLLWSSGDQDEGLLDSVVVKAAAITLQVVYGGGGRRGGKEGGRGGGDGQMGRGRKGECKVGGVGRCIWHSMITFPFLQRLPHSNAVWTGDHMQLLSTIDISVAIATEMGLMSTLIIKDANRQSVDSILNMLQQDMTQSGVIEDVPHDTTFM